MNQPEMTAPQAFKFRSADPNYAAICLVAFFVTGPLKEAGSAFPQSAMVAESARLPRVIGGTRLHAGIILALLCVFCFTT